MSLPITIAGGGPAGLAAAIVLARAGRSVCVYERGLEVGMRFRGDLQGIENWSRPHDALEELRGLGVETSFPTTPVTQISCAGPARRLTQMEDSQPFFYLVRRGPTAGTLDRSLYEQALALGVTVLLGRSLDPRQANIVATGPRGVSGIAIGYVFETDLPPQALILLDRALAPGGYGYLLITAGTGTLATTFPGDYHRARTYLQRTVAAARAVVGLDMRSPRFFGGRGSFYLARRFCRSGRLYVGEAAGLQDFCLGFGIRYALLSGVLAARSLLLGLDYDRLIQSHFRDVLRTSVVNRFAIERLSNRQFDWLTDFVPRIASPRAFLQRRYCPSWKKRLLFPLALLRTRPWLWKLPHSRQAVPD